MLLRHCFSPHLWAIPSLNLGLWFPWCHCIPVFLLHVHSRRPVSSATVIIITMCSVVLRIITFYSVLLPSCCVESRMSSENVRPSLASPTTWGSSWGRCLIPEGKCWMRHSGEEQWEATLRKTGAEQQGKSDWSGRDTGSFLSHYRSALRIPHLNLFFLCLCHSRSLQRYWTFHILNACQRIYQNTVHRDTEMSRFWKPA